MCIYSPFTIIWRYAAITDRRIRALHWTPSDLAAANAIFWTSSGWDGSEEMVSRAEQYCIRLPERTRMAFFSSDSVKTIIITLQGIQVIFLNASPTLTEGDSGEPMAQVHALVSIGNVFSSLAVLGLLRLFAAFWITDRFSYVAIDDVPLGMSRAWAISSDSLQMLPSETLKLDRPDSRFRPTSWYSRAFRFVYISLFAVTCLTALAVVFLMQGRDIQLSATVTCSIATLAVIPAFGVTTYTYYAVRHGCKSTIIPCIGKPWYKVATAVIYLTWLVLLVFSAIETRRLPCGRYTTSLAGSGEDVYLCPGLVYLQPDARSGPFGLIAQVAAVNASESGETRSRYMATYFAGSCQGAASGKGILLQGVDS